VERLGLELVALRREAELVRDAEGRARADCRELAAELERADVAHAAAGEALVAEADAAARRKTQDHAETVADLVSKQTRSLQEYEDETRRLEAAVLEAERGRDRAVEARSRHEIELEVMSVRKANAAEAGRAAAVADYEGARRRLENVGDERRKLLASMAILRQANREMKFELERMRVDRPRSGYEDAPSSRAASSERRDAAAERDATRLLRRRIDELESRSMVLEEETRVKGGAASLSTRIAQATAASAAVAATSSATPAAAVAAARQEPLPSPEDPARVNLFAARGESWSPAAHRSKGEEELKELLKTQLRTLRAVSSQ